MDPREAITLIGGTPAAAEALRARYRLTDLRHHVPPMGLRTNPEALEEAAAFAAAQKSRFVFLAVGSPQQEMLAAAIAQRGDATGVGLCIGAGIDFLAGTQVRAPVWMREARLEWAHRLALDPGRMARRYLVENPKILGLWAAWVRGHRGALRASITARSSV
jgi:exopolysaccharide biosynthesis WecB/TagA/CpsF family protein